MVAIPDEGGLRRRVAELEGTLAALQSDVQRTNVALSTSSVGVFDWNIEKKTIYVSPILQDMLGDQGKGLHPDLVQWTHYLHLAERHRAEAAIREALMYGQEFFLRTLPRDP